MDGSVIVIGVRFDGASPLAIDRASVEPLLRAVADDGIEAALLATCERTELHVVGTDVADAIERFHRALRSVGLLGEGAPCLGGDPYVAVGDAAVLHLGRVAAGLDSNVLGDHDVLAQVKGALALAEGAGTSGPVLRSAYRCAVAAGRRSRATTSIATGGTSVAGAVADRARHAPDGPALVVGAGTVGRAVARRLAKHGRSVVVANRSDETARVLAEEVGGTWVPLAEAAAAAAGAAVVVAAAPAELRTGWCRPDALLVDVAVPAAFTGSGTVVTLADVQAVGQEHHLRRLAGAVEAERVVRAAVARWADGQPEEVAA
jgi:glutamyl-tRNA reductase